MKALLAMVWAGALGEDSGVSSRENYQPPGRKQLLTPKSCLERASYQSGLQSPQAASVRGESVREGSRMYPGSCPSHPFICQCCKLSQCHKKPRGRVLFNPIHSLQPPETAKLQEKGQWSQQADGR